VAISAVGTLAQTNSDLVETTLAVSPTAVGNVLLLAVRVFSGAETVTSVSGGGVTTWTCIAGPEVDTYPGANSNREIWLGRVTATGSATITVAYSATPSVLTELMAQEFSSTLGASASWALVGTEWDLLNSASTTAPLFPSLTASTSGQLYFGHMTFEQTGANGSTSGFVYVDAPHGGNKVAYNTNVSAGAVQPNAVQAPASTAHAIAVLVTDSASTGVSVFPSLVSDRGTAANATAATTSSLTLTSPTTIAVGNYLIARVAVDNSGTNGAAPGCTVTDPRSNAWTVLGPALVDPGAVSAGATAYIAYTRVVTAYQAADALTFNWGGISTTAKAIVVEEWKNIHPTSPVAVSAVTANAAASTAVSVSITPTAPNQLVYTCLATEGIAGDTVGADADSTNGTWSTLTTTASANATATNNQRVSGQYKVVTAAGAQSWDSTITSRDWAALIVSFAPPAFPPPVWRVVREAVHRSHYW